MKLLKDVKISGFWGDKNFSMSCHRDVNFLIGVNGSGKTTAINLIAAALSADPRTLERIPFSNITIKLTELGSRKKLSIIKVTKTPAKDSPFSRIEYEIEDSSNSSGIYILDSVEEQFSLRDYPVRFLREYASLLPQRLTGVGERLKELINLSWLSIHRSENMKGIVNERDYESTIDRKLNELSIELVKYFSLLSSRTSARIDDFQKTVFLSLIPKSDELPFAVSFSDSDIESEQNALIEIFREFKVPERRYSHLVSEYFTLVNAAITAIQKKEQPSNQELSALINIRRIHSLVPEWNKLLDVRNSIYEPRETFLNVINTMLYRKELQINDKNELIVSTQSKNQLALPSLSSGEKQLIIILGQALLQQKTPSIYIADEPELSLHIDWQEQLVTNLRRINPSAQILFATHSPDIVSIYGERVFNMEKVLK